MLRAELTALPVAFISKKKTYLGALDSQIMPAYLQRSHITFIGKLETYVHREQLVAIFMHISSY